MNLEQKRFIATISHAGFVIEENLPDTTAVTKTTVIEMDGEETTIEKMWEEKQDTEGYHYFLLDGTKWVFRVEPYSESGDRPDDVFFGIRKTLCKPEGNTPRRVIHFSEIGD
jgi:hypothetical protein